MILFRELGITLMRFWVIRHAVIPASRGGKVKTLAQGTAVGMYVLVLTGPLATLRFWVMLAAVALTVVTGLDYVRQAVVLRRKGLAAERAAAREGIAAAADAGDAGPIAGMGAGGAAGDAGPVVGTSASHAVGEGVVEPVAGARGAAEADR